MCAEYNQEECPVYNQEIKERYLETLSGSTVTATRGVFEAVNNIEFEYSKDLAEFDPSIVGYFFEMSGFSEPNNIRTKLGYIASYADWYVEQFGGSHRIRDYDIFGFPYAKYFDITLCKSPEHLCNIIAQVYDVDSGQPAMAALMFAWLGVDLSDAVALKKEQVDTWHGKIYDATGGLIVHHMPEAIRERLDIYSKTYSAIRVQNQTFTVYAEDIGYFIKRMKTANSDKKVGPFSSKQMMSLLTMMRDKYADQFGKESAILLNYSNVQRSGNFYRLHQLAQSGVDVRKLKNSDKVRMCLGKSKRNHKDNMIMYDAYLKCIGEK